VSDKIAKYVAQNVNSSGWQAVWRSTPKSSGHNQPFDVLVEVGFISVYWPAHCSLPDGYWGQMAERL